MERVVNVMDREGGRRGRTERQDGEGGRRVFQCFSLLSLIQVKSSRFFFICGNKRSFKQVKSVSVCVEC